MDTDTFDIKTGHREFNEFKLATDITVIDKNPKSHKRLYQNNIHICRLSVLGKKKALVATDGSVLFVTVLKDQSLPTGAFSYKWACPSKITFTKEKDPNRLLVQVDVLESLICLKYDSVLCEPSIDPDTLFANIVRAMPNFLTISMKRIKILSSFLSTFLIDKKPRVLWDGKIMDSGSYKPITFNLSTESIPMKYLVMPKQVLSNK